MVASVRLSTVKDPSYGILKKKTGAAPDPAIYGIYDQALAQLLAQPTQGETEKYANRIELRSMADHDRQAYQDALEAAQRGAIEQARLEGSYNLAGKAIDTSAARANAGIDSQYGYTLNANGDPVNYAHPEAGVVADAATLNKTYADTAKTKADTYGVLADKLGTPPTVGYMGQDLATNPMQDQPVPLQEGFESPALKVRQYGTDEGLTVEEQINLAIQRAQAGKSDEDKGAVITYNGGADGNVPVVSIKGTAEQVPAARQRLREQGYDPDTMKPIRPISPNAGTHDGGVSATPAVKPRPVGNVKSIIKSLYPQAQITSLRRDPKSKLGRANPDSWHNSTDAAADVKPIKGMTFEQYVNGFKAHGYEIIEAKDEAKHPVKWTTGPNWHVVLGQPRSNTTMLVARAKASPYVASVVDNGDGTILVTTKSGRRLVYNAQGQNIGG